MPSAPASGEQGCTACRNACPNGALTFDEKGKPVLDWTICNKCQTIECSEVCAAHALKQCVRFLTVDDLMKILMRDYPNWGSDGGVTFSGGEPLLHHEFLDQVLRRCRKEQMHTAIETSAFASPEVFEKIFRNLNFAFIDVKNMDEEMHKWGNRRQQQANSPQYIHAGKRRLVARQARFAPADHSRLQ